MFGHFCDDDLAFAVVEQITNQIPNLKVEMLEPVMCKGFPSENDFKALDAMAGSIAAKHEALRLVR